MECPKCPVSIFGWRVANQNSKLAIRHPELGIRKLAILLIGRTSGSINAAVGGDLKKAGGEGQAFDIRTSNFGVPRTTF